MARDIAVIEPHLLYWGEWLPYLLEKLEEEAQRRGIRADYEEMLMELRQEFDKYYKLVAIR